MVCFGSFIIFVLRGRPAPAPASSVWAWRGGNGKLVSQAAQGIREKTHNACINKLSPLKGHSTDNFSCIMSSVATWTTLISSVLYNKCCFVSDFCSLLDFFHLKMYMQPSGSSLYEFMVSCKPMWAGHSCLHDTMMKMSFIH